MTPQETLVLCRLAKAACPQQAIDELTPDAWVLLLDDIRFDDAKAALIDLAKVQPFVSPAEIRKRVKVIRAERIAAATFDPPADLPDNEVDYRRWLGEERRRVADGEPATTAPNLPRRDMRQIEGVVKKVGR